MKRVFVSDCEGPISKNDNAYELTAEFVPEGDKIFSIVSKYDDVLADLVIREGYNAGDTLKLVLPFLKSSDITDNQMKEFSSQHLFLIAGTKETLGHIANLSESFIVSTSYEHYIRALCECIKFPFENTYCTRVIIDSYTLTDHEKEKLSALAKEIAAMHMIVIPSGAKSLGDISTRDQQTVKRLDEIFWHEIRNMKIGKMFSDVTPVGGEQKAEAIRDIVKRCRVSLSDVMYVGDSITDVQAFELVREGGGLTVSFNGNAYAVRKAEVAVQADNNFVIAIIADAFLNYGKERAIGLAEVWSLEELRENEVKLNLMERLRSLYPNGLPNVTTVTPKNVDTLSKESSKFRKKVRGEAVGKLG